MLVDIKITGRARNSSALGTVINELVGSRNKDEAREVVSELTKSHEIDKSFMFYFGGSHLSVLDKHKGSEVIFIHFKDN